MGLPRLGDFAKAILVLVLAKISPSCIHFFRARHPDPVVIHYRLIRRVRPGLVNDQMPVRIRMLHDNLPMPFFYNLQGQ